MSGGEAAGMLVALLQALGGGKLLTVFIILFLLPCLLYIYALREAIKALLSLRDEVRQSIVQANRRYSNNVILVEQYEKMSRELMAVVKNNTENATRLGELVEQQIKKGR